MDTQEFRRAFHRGRLFVLMLAVGTGLVVLGDGASIVWWRDSRDVISAHVMNWVLAALIGWWLYRGGRFVAGCLGVLYGINFLCFVAAVIYGAVNVFLSGDPLDGVQGWSDTAMFFLVGAWATFALWALLFSKDVRLYREAQRLAIRAQEADAFAWPPAGRRQG